MLPRLFCFSLVMCLFAAAAVTAAEIGLPNLKSGLVEKAAGGQIDWGKEMFYAVGEGAVPTPAECPNRAKAFLKAKDYAKMDAIANMQMLIKGTSISYSATGKDYMVNDATLTQKIQGFVKNVVVLRTEKIKQGSDMTVKVTVACPMYGYDGPGAALLQKASEQARTVGQEIMEEQAVEKSVASESPTAAKSLDLAPVTIEIKGAPKTVVEPEPIAVKATEVKAAEEQPVAQPDTSVQIPVAPEPPASSTVVTAEAKSEPTIEKVSAPAANVVYTSVIVDTLGLNVMRAMSPKIRTQSGAELYGTLQISPDDVQDAGPVAYVRTLVDAKKSPRAGASPLIVKAIGRAGGRRMCDVVLSDDDVEKVKAADAASRPPFLAAMKVIFIVDPLKL